MVHGQLNLYDTDPVLNGNWFQFDCLHYYLTSEELLYQDLLNVIVNTIPYCVRPINRIDVPVGDFNNTRGQKWSFEELRLANITTEQLLSWSATIDATERYQFYVDELNSSLNELFYNCTPPWFGSRCQYSFELAESMSVEEMIEATFHRRRPYNESSDTMIQLPCYVGIRCDRGGSLLCLDWREVCDGRVDCLDGGLDEAFCFEMEMNECGEHEYRCHNGLCIPEEFWEGASGNVECLDRSDELVNVEYSASCFQDPTFRCEEHTCRMAGFQFACGDGECVQKASRCHNGRHAQLLHSFAVQGNLSDKCWIAMSCLTILVTQINGTSCETWLTNVTKLLRNCPSLFQFPTIPIHFDHIRLFYRNSHSNLNTTRFLLPDYVCYDQQLCPFLKPSFSDSSLTCLLRSDVQLHPEIFEVTRDPWFYLLNLIDYKFHYCLISSMSIVDEIKLRDHPSLYQCQNSSKFISKNRIHDRNRDCHLRDDETYEDSCSLNNRFRVKCLYGNMCLSASLTLSDCSLVIDRYQMKVPFRIVCDGFIDAKFKDSNGQIHTDESECSNSYWPCDNLYTRCDNFWTCPDGRDEEHCTPNKCSSKTQMCVHPSNFTLMCLPSELVANGQVNCLGGSDEPSCQRKFPGTANALRFHCLNLERCLPSSQLCDGHKDCPLGDDEEFCEHHRFNCHKDFIYNRTDVEDFLCRLTENYIDTIHYFSLKTSSVYPFKENIPIGQDVRCHRKQDTRRSNRLLANEHDSWSWHCNRGLPLRIWSTNDHYEHICLCPPSYYGHLCQYQSERVSLTLGFVEHYQHGAYTILIMLMDHHQDIHSFDQFVYITKQSCSVKFNRYLLYSTRPKNRAQNYSLRIDAYSKNTLRYHGSWHFPIPFLFLPVNRLAAILDVPSSPAAVSSGCWRTCDHGQCMKYVNDEKYFCHCFPGWSGIDCNRTIDCTSCSSDSICTGQFNNRPICICPMTKFGPRCFLESSCPRNGCQNGGQCVPATTAESRSTYACICPSNYFGSRCQYFKGRIEVALDDMVIPSYLLAFIFTVSNQSEPRSTIMLQKLTLFQRVVTFQISIPFHLVFIKADQDFYLAVVQKYDTMDISTSINPERRCIPVEELLNSTLLAMNRLQRIQFYHGPCQQYLHISCFIDEYYLCLCTNERHANCLTFDRDLSLTCSSKYSCANGAACFQDHPTCPLAIICACTNCFFGDKCQFYAKGFGLTLDEILGYEIKHNTPLSKQPLSVLISAIITMIMFAIGIVNAILAILTFKNNKNGVGCGMYLYASSITSLFVVILLPLKFWFLILSRMDSFIQQIIPHTNCMIIEPVLKSLLYMDYWLNACVALERAWSVFQGIHFNKKRSRQVARRLIIGLIAVLLLLLIPQLSQIHLFNDEKEERSWCVVHYSSSLQWYSSVMIFFHIFTPFVINLFSSIFIIVQTTRQREITGDRPQFWKHFKSKLKQYRHLLISPIVLIILSLPHLIISLTLECHKSSRNFHFYLSGYFVSFIPSMLVFVIFVLPSKLYRKKFKEELQRMKRHKFKFCL